MRNNEIIRQQILHVACDEIGKRGIKFTMEHISTRLTISKRTIYKHFSSKSHLIENIVDMVLAEIDQNNISIYQDLPVVARFKHLLILYCHATKPFNSLTQDELKRYYPSQWDKVVKIRQRIWSEITCLLQGEMDVDKMFPVKSSIVQHIIDGVLNEIRDGPFHENCTTLCITMNEIADILLFGITYQEIRLTRHPK